ncbi:MAG TPA: sulfite exporter TauE/SafE family protein [Pyrinomonadaceae bacterium]|nr:sulfite exporter TauE/SafE family protein [Pyrinomonadaceae bacterium]
MLSLLALGFVLGLKHALDADHLAAVSTMATERRSLFASSLIGALWGLGHTISLMLAGVFVILLHFEIGERASKFLELSVGLMLITLGINALRKLAGGRIHMHAHEHDGHWHVHPHLHERGRHDQPHTHHGLKSGARPLLVGMVHGLAGSAALTLLVLATIPSALIGFLYIVIFGIGSIGGMMIMSTLFALPAKLTAERFARANFALRGLAGIFSLAFGVFMIYYIGFVDHF